MEPKGSLPASKEPVTGLIKVKKKIAFLVGIKYILRVLLPLLSTAAQWDKFPSSTAQGEVISV
jgi:hypothetical protein